MAVSLARWRLLGRSSNAASRVNIGFGCLASLTQENLRLGLLQPSQRLEPNRHAAGLAIATNGQRSAMAAPTRLPPGGGASTAMGIFSRLANLCDHRRSCRAMPYRTRSSRQLCEVRNVPTPPSWALADRALFSSRHNQPQAATKKAAAIPATFRHPTSVSPLAITSMRGE